MAKSLERQVKDAIIAKIKSLPGIVAVNTSGRGRVVAETDLPSGQPALFLSFPSSKREGGCGFYRVTIPVHIDARTRFDGDLDALDPETVRDALDALEQSICGAMDQDPTWSARAFDTRPRKADRPSKQTSEDVDLPEATLSLVFEVEIHHASTDPQIRA